MVEKVLDIGVCRGFVFLFTGQCGHAGCKLEFEFIDDGEITDVQTNEHWMLQRLGGAVRFPRPQCSLLRRILK